MPRSIKISSRIVGGWVYTDSGWLEVSPSGLFPHSFLPVISLQLTLYCHLMVVHYLPSEFPDLCIKQRIINHMPRRTKKTAPFHQWSHGGAWGTAILLRNRRLTARVNRSAPNTVARQN